ncbi:MAG: biopolymer transporter ExbD [Myxococcaceae bacterium]|nr:biopolymer transporter ExbD [Myxococcaceae bacterium]
MAFYYSKRKLKVKEPEDTGELNIVPYLDILMNLIIFLLLSINGLAAFGILNVSAPNYGPSAGVGGDDEKPQQILSVLISKKGFYIAGSGGVLGQTGTEGTPAPEGDTSAPPTIPLKPDGTYDFAALTEHMKAVKSHEAFREQTKVIIGAEADVAYENLIGTMDAVRETKDKKLLFPDVTLAAM